MPGTYYLEPAESGCIGLTRIDADRSGRWDRIVQSVRVDIALHRRLPGFRQLIQSRHYGFHRSWPWSKEKQRGVDLIYHGWI